MLLQLKTTLFFFLHQLKEIIEILIPYEIVPQGFNLVELHVYLTFSVPSHPIEWLDSFKEVKVSFEVQW